MAAEPPVLFVGPEAVAAVASGWLVVCADSCGLRSSAGTILELAGEQRSSHALLAAPAARRLVRERAAGVVVWKSSLTVERLAGELGVTLANSPAALARRLENKAYFSQAAAAAGLPVPEFVTGTAGPELAEAAGRLGMPVVFQLAHGFSGAGTHRVDTGSALMELCLRHRGHPCRISRLVSGTPVTVTGVAHPDFLEMGPACLQLTGIPSLTPHPMGSCGNDFEAPVPHRPEVEATALRVGSWVRAQGHRGVFGVDLVVGPDGTCWCIEVNPRLVASVPLWSLSARDTGAASLLDLHLSCFGLSSRSRGPLTCHWSQLILYQGERPFAAPQSATASGLIDPQGRFRRTGDLFLDGPLLGQVGLVMRRASRPGKEAARVILKGPLVDSDGALLPPLRALVAGLRAEMEAPGSS
jgi:predicted ATP-grasp superfamily ATP-dependent carboligase